MDKHWKQVQGGLRNGLSRYPSLFDNRPRLKKIIWASLYPPPDRDYLWYLWYEDYDISKKVVEYRIKVHVFGNSADARQFVERQFYVDGGLTSVTTPEEAVDLLTQTREMLADSLTYLVSCEEKPFTRRGVLSTVCTTPWACSHNNARESICQRAVIWVSGMLLSAHKRKTDWNLWKDSLKTCTSKGGTFQPCCLQYREKNRASFQMLPQ